MTDPSSGTVCREIFLAAGVSGNEIGEADDLQWGVYEIVAAQGSNVVLLERRRPISDGLLAISPNAEPLSAATDRGLLLRQGRRCHPAGRRSGRRRLSPRQAVAHADVRRVVDGRAEEKSPNRVRRCCHLAPTTHDETLTRALVVTFVSSPVPSWLTWRRPSTATSRARPSSRPAPSTRLSSAGWASQLPSWPEPSASPAPLRLARPSSWSGWPPTPGTSSPGWPPWPPTSWPGWPPWPPTSWPGISSHAAPEPDSSSRSLLMDLCPGRRRSVCPDPQ